MIIQTITEFVIEDCSFKQEKEACLIAQLLKTNTVSHYFLYFNFSFTNIQTLTVLNMGHNEIGDNGMQLICKALQNNTV